MTKEFTITEEAKKLLAKEAGILAEELREEAIAEALRSRGRPVEVTASDVRRARLRFVKQEERRSKTEVLMQVYMIMGYLISIVAVVSSLVLQDNPVFYLLMTVGLMMVGVGLLTWFYLRKKSRTLERYKNHEQRRQDEKLS